MHKKFLTLTDMSHQVYHPEFVRFEKNSIKFGSKTSNWVDSIARNELQISVQNHIYEKHSQRRRDNRSKLLHVRLKASVDKYAVYTDNEKFDIL